MSPNPLKINQFPKKSRRKHQKANPPSTSPSATRRFSPPTAASSPTTKSSSFLPTTSPKASTSTTICHPRQGRQPEMLRNLRQTLTRRAEPCPKTETAPAKASEWAKEKLNFHPEPKQIEVLDSTSKYLILCCNRQWGKTTNIAIKALHYALTNPDQTIVLLSRTKAQVAMTVLSPSFPS